MDRNHALRIDPAPYRVRMAANLAIEPALLEEHNSGWLPGQTEALLRPLDRRLEDVLIDKGIAWWVQAEGIEMLAAARGPADRLGLPERRHEIVAHEAAEVADNYALVLVLHQVERAIPRPAALIADKDHRRLGSRRPRARTRSCRMAAMSAAACWSALAAVVSR
ncbi:MAG: hypothetical protein AAGH41_14770 [Pseudomonadota bacterium]